MVLSITEGEDKPLKYPLAFREADAVVLTKIDLSRYQRPDMTAMRENLRRVNPAITIIELSARAGSDLDAWIAWIVDAVTRRGVIGSRARTGRLDAIEFSL